MKKYHPLFHKLKAIVGYSIATVVIIIALAVSGLRLLMTTADLYQQEVEQLASSLLQQPVKISTMDARLSGLVPTLIFRNVSLLSQDRKKSLLDLSRIDVGLSVDALLFKREIVPVQVTVKGLDLRVSRNVQGKISIKGLDIDALLAKDRKQKDSSSVLNRLLSQKAELAFEDSTLSWKDEQNAGLFWFFDQINILLKKTENRQQLLLSSRLPAELGEQLKLAIDLEGELDKPESWQVKSYLKTDALKLQPLQRYIKNKKIKLHKGSLGIELWADWKHKQLTRLSGDVSLQNLSYHFTKKDRVNLRYVSAVFDAVQANNKAWNVSVEQLAYKSKQQLLKDASFSMLVDYKDNNLDTLILNAARLKLDTLSKIIIDTHLLEKKQEKMVQQLAMQGEIDEMSLIWRDNRVEKLQGDVNDFAMKAWKNLPNLSGIQGSIEYNNGSGRITLASTRAILGFPLLFRNDFKLQQLSAEMAFMNTPQGILLDIEKVRTQNSDVSAESRVKLWIPDKGSAYMDLQAYISDANIAAIPEFLPVSIMSNDLVKWLDKAFVKGKVSKGTVIYNGTLAAFPFNDRQGTFSVDVAASDFTLHYQDGWPDITRANVDGLFTGQGMQLHLSEGLVEKNRMIDSQADIASFANALLKVRINASGNAAATTEFLVNSPILENARETVKSFRIGGKVKTSVNLAIPLDSEMAEKTPIRYNGTSRLDNFSLSMLEDRLDIRNGEGEISFNEKGLSSKNLAAKFIGKPAEFELLTEKDGKAVRLSAKGKILPAEIMKRFALPAADKISGETFYRANFYFPAKRRKNVYPRLQLKTSLRGIKSTLPEFLYKKPGSRNDTEFTARFVKNSRVQLGLAFVKKGSFILELDNSGKQSRLTRAAISFSARKARLPRKRLLYIDGALSRFTPEKWNKALNLGKYKDVSTLVTIPVALNMSRLKIITSKKKEKKSASSLNPIKLPTIEGIIRKLYLNKLYLGRLDFTTSKYRYGLKLDEFILSARNMKLTGTGRWQYRNRKHSSSVKLTMHSLNFGGMLKDLDYAVVIRDGEARSLVNANWNDSPNNFSLKKLKADIQLNIKNGNISKVDAGAGRLLGLFSLSALPKKLTGDFKETVKEGFSFDKADGKIHIEQGDAYTDDFTIISSVAKIQVSGRTGLVAQDYENVVEVTPEVGSGVAGVTALLVNLPAGIGVWLLDKLTGEQFNKASTKIYEITGTWEKPEIKQINLEVESEQDEEDQQ